MGTVFRLRILFFQLLERLNGERDRVSDVIRQEFTDRIIATEEENRRVKQVQAEMKSRHRIEIDRFKTETEIVQKSKQDEMDEVHKRFDKYSYSANIPCYNVPWL